MCINFSQSINNEDQKILTTVLYNVGDNVARVDSSVLSEYTDTTIWVTNNVVNNEGRGSTPHLGANDPSETNLIVGNSNISNNSQGIVIAGTNNQMINSDVSVMGQKKCC